VTATITTLFITPVKSTRLHRPERVRLESFGVLENRRFYVAEPDGRLFNNTKFGPLQRVRADWDPMTERLSLCFPDGGILEGDATAVDGEVETNFFGRDARGHVLAGPFSDAVSEYVGRRLVVVRTDRPGDASDSAPVSLYSRSSADAVDRQGGRSTPHDRRRWRMLVEIDGVGPHEEDSWIGYRVRLGRAVIRVTRPVGRCVITTQDPETGTPDFDTLRTITSYRGLRNGKSIDFGVYADVEAPGAVAVGDAVEVLVPSPADR
jgi:uncharacterized protein YcbX